ncbi:PEG10: Retrotransposon-derived protein PEG10 [Crotalus adamanteus]|uniref:ribonuclease H n=1 Tax=Crotalus adamanteus TaxID=8729 RepID=A0AAW1BCZ7_CROAD
MGPVPPPQQTFVKHFVLPATVFVPGQGEVDVQALVDSGATANFMDSDFVTQWSIPQLVAATRSLHIRIGPHMEEAVFYVATVSHFPVVLGLEWLRAHDPQIIWSSGTVRFPGKKCAPHHLHVCAGKVATPVDLDLPAELGDYADVFGEKEADQLPLHWSYDCPVDLMPDAKLPVGRIYSQLEPDLAALRDFVDKNLQKGFIWPSTSLLAAPVLFMKKKSGELRLCCDYRKLNAITICNWYPLLLIPELIERLHQAKIFTKLDLRGAYNLIRVGNEWKTAFQMRYGHFEYMVMPFGLTKAPGVFMHFMHDVFRDLLDKFVVIYLDDILIYSSSSREHWNHVQLVLQRLWDNHLLAKR